MFGIWKPSNNPNTWKNFKEHLPFGILEWEVEERTTSANFLDLTISINKYRKINTIIYQKAMNLYLYLPPTSAHPLSVICGMIYGILRKYDKQNSHQRHYIETTVLLFRRLATRGWDTTLLQTHLQRCHSKSRDKMSLTNAREKGKSR